MRAVETRNPGSRADRAGASHNTQTNGHGLSLHHAEVIRRLQYRLSACCCAIDVLTPDLDYAMRCAWLMAKGMKPPADAPQRLNRLSLRLIDARHVLEAELPEEVWEAMHPETGNSVPTLGGRGNTEFAADTARTAGESKRRKEVWEAMHPETATSCRGLGGRGKTEFPSETADVTGQTPRDIQRHVSRAEALGDDLEARQ